MLEIRLYDGKQYSMVDKEYTPTTDLLATLISKAREYVKNGYRSACVYLVNQVYIGNSSKDEKLALFYCNANLEKMRKLNSSRMIIISTCLNDVDLLEKALDVMVRCEGVPAVYKQYQYKKCPSCGLYHHGKKGDCLTCKKIKRLGFKIIKNKDVIRNYYYC